MDTCLSYMATQSRLSRRSSIEATIEAIVCRGDRPSNLLSSRSSIEAIVYRIDYREGQRLSVEEQVVAQTLCCHQLHHPYNRPHRSPGSHSDYRRWLPLSAHVCSSRRWSSTWGWKMFIVECSRGRSMCLNGLTDWCGCHHLNVCGHPTSIALGLCHLVFLQKCLERWQTQR